MNKYTYIRCIYLRALTRNSGGINQQTQRIYYIHYITSFVCEPFEWFVCFNYYNLMEPSWHTDESLGFQVLRHPQIATCTLDARGDVGLLRFLYTGGGLYRYIYTNTMNIHKQWLLSNMFLLFLQTRVATWTKRAMTSLILFCVSSWFFDN